MSDTNSQTSQEQKPRVLQLLILSLLIVFAACAVYSLFKSQTSEVPSQRSDW